VLVLIGALNNGQELSINIVFYKITRDRGKSRIEIRIKKLPRTRKY
jgi:hypothetical protein